MRYKIGQILLTLAAFGACASAHAVSISVGGCDGGSSGLTTCVAGASVQTFDNGTLPSNYAATAGSGGHVVSGTTGTYAAPVGDTTDYLSVPSSTSSGTVTDTLGGQYNYFGLYWGSIDTYNTLTFLDHGSVVATVTGADVIGDLSKYGNQSDPASNEYVNFNFGSQRIDQVAFTSNGYAFESDNHAVADVPEPELAGLMALGLVGLFARRRRTR